MPTGKEAGGKSAAAAGEDVAALVEAAEAALEGGHFREPLEGSLALALMQLSLAEPGNEAIPRLRREAAAVLVPRAEKAMKKKQWLDAAAAWRDLVAVWPDHPTAKEPYLDSLKRAGSILRKSQDHAEALALADELLVHEPESFAALVLRGDACMGLERYLDAVNAYRSAMRVKPRDKAVKKKYWRARGKLGAEEE
jgi:tetratricopeptide (TPR) repeat protein